MEQNRFWSHLLKYWPTHTLPFAERLTQSQFNDSDIQIHIISYYTTRYTLSHNTLMCSVGYLIILRKYRLFYYFVELYPTFLYCWAIPILNHCLHTPYFSTMLGNSQFQYIDELNPILTHCLGVSNFNILLRKTPAQYIAEIYWILTHCWGLPIFNTLLSYTPF